MLGVGADEAAAGGDELHRGDRVGLKAVLAGQPAHAAAERVTGDPDVGRRAVQAGQTVGGQPRGDPVPLDPGADAHAPGRRVDADLLQRADVQQQRVLEAPERTLVVGSGLRRDAEARIAGVGDRCDDVVGVGGEGNRRGMLVEQEVEGRPGFVPAGVVGEDDGAGECFGER